MFQAKTHLPEIIRKIEATGEDVCLTKNNREIAFIVSVQHYHFQKKAAILEQLKMLKRKAPIGDMNEIIEMRGAGRK